VFRDSLPDQLKNTYLERYAWPGPILQEEPHKNTKIIVVIPCFNEPDLLESLTSLFNCTPTECHVEVIVVVNHGEDETEDIKEINISTLESIEKWVERHHRNDLTFFTINALDLPKKQAGVGLARKIGMDEAVRRFDFLNLKKGIIVCFDADCHCSPNYLQEIYQFYLTTPKANAALVYFEHLLEGKFDDDVYSGIINYELHLRYYKNALRFAHLPYQFHTVGSCITVSSEAYQKQGGMNRRKAGEDFYFLQKIFALGHIYNINSATVFPSPRPSDRVPFGTGKAINDLLNAGDTTYLTYNPQTFIDLRSLIDKVPKLYQKNKIESIVDELPLSIQNYLNEINYHVHILKIKKNCSSESQFIKSFYNWFNAFMTLKYVHFARDRYYNETGILEAANWILKELNEVEAPIKSKKIALMHLRDLDRLN
jgi:GT2 family glycosyltransferase